MDHIVIMQCSAESLWFLAFIWMWMWMWTPLDLRHPSKHHCGLNKPSHGEVPPQWQLLHHKNCSGTTQGTWQGAQIVNPAFKFSRSHTDSASVGCAGTSRIHGGPSPNIQDQRDTLPKLQYLSKCTYSITGCILILSLWFMIVGEITINNHSVP